MPQRDGRQHGVRLPGERAEHLQAPRLVGRLAEQAVTQDDGRVGGEHRRFLAAFEPRDDRLRLACGDPLHVVEGSLSRKRRLADVSADDAVPHADLVEELATAFRGRGEDDGVVTH